MSRFLIKKNNESFLRLASNEVGVRGAECLDEKKKLEGRSWPPNSSNVNFWHFQL